MHNGFRIPPDSTGKLLVATRTASMGYTDGLRTIEAGETVTGQTSHAVGVVTKVEGSVSSGEVHVSFTEAESEFLAGEVLVQFGEVCATVASPIVYYHFQNTMLAGGNNPHNLQHVDARGAATVRYADGHPLLDVFGNMRTTELHILGIYEYSTDGYDDLFFTETLNGGVVERDIPSSCMLLTVPTTNGAVARRITNRHHYYQPGCGLLVTQVIGMGDVGRNGNTRRWGYYDELDGYYFEMEGTQLNLVVRSSTGGVAETRIPQSLWNVDRLDGSGLSDFNLANTKINLFWMDLTWQGSVRFGVYGGDGSRIIAHILSGINALDFPRLKKASLPIQVENINTSTTGGPSLLRVGASVIQAYGNPDYTFWRFSDMFCENVAINATLKPLLSVRPKPELAPGEPNHVNVYPCHIAVTVVGGDAKIVVVQSPETLTGATWSLPGESTIEGDNTASAVVKGATGYEFIAFHCGAGSHNIDLREHFELNDEGILLAGDGSQTPITFAAKSLSGTNVTVSLTFTYRELR